MTFTDDIFAWVHRDASPATAARGPLAGLTFGVKDNLDVAGLPTGYGLLDRPPRLATVDAWCVARLRAAGAIPLGKTHSTPLASKDPALTRHPHLRERTPGGSSAGSAAAVAAGHVPFALGTQTQGSVVRPAAFCGVVGFKPTYGAIPVSGLNPFAPSFDTIGIIAADLATAAAVTDALLDLDEVTPSMRLGWAPATFAERFTPATRALLDAFVAQLATRFAIETIVLDAPARAVDPLYDVMRFEARAVLAPFRAAGPLPPGIDEFLTTAESVDEPTYRSAKRALRDLGRTVLARLESFDAVLLPIVDEPPAPTSTGDPIPQAPWTAWGVPTLSLPVGRLASGASISLGIVAPRGADATALAVAAQLAKVVAG